MFVHTGFDSFFIYLFCSCISADANTVRSAGNAGWGAPKAFVSELAKTLEASNSHHHHPRLNELVADLIEDKDGKWWLTQASLF